MITPFEGDTIAPTQEMNNRPFDIITLPPETTNDKFPTLSHKMKDLEQWHQ